MTPDLKRQRTVHCAPEDQALIREQAAKAGTTISGYLLDLVHNDDPMIHSLVLSPDEQREVLAAARQVSGIVHALSEELPGTGGPGIFAALELMADK